MSKNFIDLAPPKNRWKKVGIISVVLLLVSAGASGYSVWQYIDQRSEIDRLQNELMETQNELRALQDTEANDTDTEEANGSDNYLVVEEWGVRYRIPDGVNEVSYEISVSEDGVRTLNVESMVATCQVAVSVTRHSSRPDVSADMGAGRGHAVFQSGQWWYQIQGISQTLVDACTNEADVQQATNLVDRLIEMVSRPQEL